MIKYGKNVVEKEPRQLANGRKVLEEETGFLGRSRRRKEDVRASKINKLVGKLRREQDRKKAKSVSQKTIRTFTVYRFVNTSSFVPD